MHAGITAITELAVKSGLTNRSPCWKTIPDYLETAGGGRYLHPVLK